MTALESRICETATWILKLNPQFEHNYFRSEELRPLNKIRLERKLPTTSLEAIKQVTTKRRDALAAADTELLSLTEALACGSLIYTYPSDSTLDGGAEFYSQGLVDIWEVPAWDTWISIGNFEFSEFGAYEDCIISWIPESVYNLFYSGREVGLENNLDWILQIPGNSMLASSATAPTNLQFVEVSDHEEVERRLNQINAQVIVEVDLPEQEASASPPLWAKIKRWFL